MQRLPLRLRIDILVWKIPFAIYRKRLPAVHFKLKCSDKPLSLPRKSFVVEEIETSIGRCNAAIRVLVNA